MELIGIIIGAVCVAVLWSWMLALRRTAPAANETARRQRGLEPITWLLIIGGMVAAAIALLVLYQQVLVDQGAKVEEQDIPCVYLDIADDTMKAGTLQPDGSCGT